MSAALRQPMTRDAFLAWEERQPVKYEFDGVGPAATVFSRTGDLWAVEVLTGVETISLPEIGATLPLADCYRGVTFPKPEAEPT